LSLIEIGIEVRAYCVSFAVTVNIVGTHDCMNCTPINYLYYLRWGQMI